jgi:hypothetical protein
MTKPDVAQPQVTGSFDINFLSFGTERVTRVARVEGRPGWGFNVSPDGRWLLYTRMEDIESDLMMVEGFR